MESRCLYTIFGNEQRTTIDKITIITKNISKNLYLQEKHIYLKKKEEKRKYKI